MMVRYLEKESVKDVIDKEFNFFRENFPSNPTTDEYAKKLYMSIMRKIDSLPYSGYDKEEMINTIREQTDYIIRLENCINTMMEVCKQ